MKNPDSETKTKNNAGSKRDAVLRIRGDISRKKRGPGWVRRRKKRERKAVLLVLRASA